MQTNQDYFKEHQVKTSYFLKGADWILRLLDLESSDTGVTLETQQFVSDFITKYRKEL